MERNHCLYLTVWCKKWCTSFRVSQVLHYAIMFANSSEWVGVVSLTGFVNCGEQLIGHLCRGIHFQAKERRETKCLFQNVRGWPWLRGWLSSKYVARWWFTRCLGHVQPHKTCQALHDRRMPCILFPLLQSDDYSSLWYDVGNSWCSSLLMAWT